MSGRKPRVICPYCQQEARLATHFDIYQKHGEKKFWLCRPCWAYVGCHKDSKNNIPLGRLANTTLRRWKIRAHDAFDPLWKAKMVIDQCSKNQARKAAYSWLSRQLDISAKECHIGMFNVETCKRVVEICESVPKRRN